MRRRNNPIPGNRAFFELAWRFVFLVGAAGSGAAVVVLSGTSAGAASATLAASAEAGGVAEAVLALAAGAVGAGVAGGVLADFADASAGAAALPECDDGGADTPGCGGPIAGTAVATGAAGVADGTAAVRMLVTIARAATGVFSGSVGWSISDKTTPAPAVAPIAVATSTTRAVRAKLGAGAK